MSSVKLELHLAGSDAIDKSADNESVSARGGKGREEKWMEEAREKRQVRVLQMELKMEKGSMSLKGTLVFVFEGTAGVGSS